MVKTWECVRCEDTGLSGCSIPTPDAGPSTTYERKQEKHKIKQQTPEPYLPAMAVDESMELETAHESYKGRLGGAPHSSGFSAFQGEPIGS